MSTCRIIPCLGFALALALLGTGCFDFDKDYRDCLRPGGNCTTDGGVTGTPDSGTPDSGIPDGGPCVDRLCLLGSYSTPGRTALFTVWGTAPYDVWFAGEFMNTAHWTGLHFIPEKIGPAAYTAPLYKLWGTSSSDIWAAGPTGILMRFNGTQWEDQNQVSNLGPFLGAWSPAPNQVLIAGPELYQWNAGSAGIPLTNDDFGYRGVWGLGSGQVWAVGYDSNSTGVISERASDGGWPPPTPYPGLGSFRAIHGTSANNVWVVGDANGVMHRTATGWQVMPLPVSAPTFDFFSVWAAPEGDVYMTTDSPTVVRYEVDGGWSTFTPPGAEGIDLRGVYGFPEGDIWFSGGAYDAATDKYDGGFAFHYRRQY